MARFLKGIHGAYNGKVGNVIGSSWRNVDYVRSLSKITSKKASPKQLAQQAKFALGVSFLSPIKDLLNLGFSDSLQGKATGYNKALQHILSNGIAGEYPDLELNFASILVARGGLSNLMGVHWEETDPRQLQLNWEIMTNKYNAFVDDSIILLVYNIEKSFFSILESGTRADGSLDVSFPAVYSGDTIVGWVFTGHRDGVKTSSSHYLGEITVS